MPWPHPPEAPSGAGALVAQLQQELNDLRAQIKAAQARLDALNSIIAEAQPKAERLTAQIATAKQFHAKVKPKFLELAEMLDAI
jgi:predicted  nucleic acid-binding Zn-ribbon protein